MTVIGNDAALRDAADPLAHLRDRFHPTPGDAVYLNGGSLGRLPTATAGIVDHVVRAEWGDGLAGARTTWFDMCERMGDRVAEVALGAHPGEVVVGDCTSVNLYKLAAAVLDADPGRRAIVTDDDNFPTDQYVLAGVAAERGGTLRRLHTDPDRGLDLDLLREAVDDDVALVSLSLVSCRSGALFDIAEVQEIAHAAGALVLWDLSHAAGAVPVDLAANGADLAVGSTYKHLFAGPGAPAFLYVRRDLHTVLAQPIHGWYGHREQLAMRGDYEADPTIRRFLTGSPPILSAVAIEAGLAVIAEAGLEALRAKSVALTGYLQELLEPTGLRLASPVDPARRGAHVTYGHPRSAQLVPLLAENGVFVDYSVPDRLRLTPAPLSTRFADVATAAERIRGVLERSGL
ncbi:kynureninase [Umezawaea tangerina]|uniref:Kynureninase n=1 Tax=Umezawaea tangerina TaxID=84725 RepID=A0A2T0TGG3_9PSEU|nr:aminotransferase class V-fold PLP-dependent enzyme [Umezawaea tangerina]PRY44764.1 kynureninase [Umezawaea tangerina]